MIPKYKLLLIEDDPLLLNLYQEVLENAGFQTETVADGESAYLKIIQNKYDLIITDMMIPKLNAMQIMEKLALHSGIKNRKILLLTNVTDEKVKRKMLELGVIDILSKTNYTPITLIEKIKQFI
jgi:DNA-binding response OmpR family regulator